MKEQTLKGAPKAKTLTLIPPLPPQNPTMPPPSAIAFYGKLRDFMLKYGDVFLFVHCSVSVVSTAGLYVAIRNNVDVEALLEKVGLSGVKADDAPAPPADPTVILDGDEFPQTEKNKKENRTAELEASNRGALALAMLCDRKLFPVRLPITIGLTPLVAKFLRARNISL